MRFPLFICLWLMAAVGVEAAPGLEDAIDRWDEKLGWASPDNRFRARVSGTIELEDYHFQSVPTGLIHADGKELFNPRLVLFLDAQAGSQVYFFAQTRLDRGFDPSEGNAQVRLDEYAVRFTPNPDGRFNFQIGKFATIVGNWTARHLAWDNPFIGAPLPYENLTGVFDEAAADSVPTLLKWARLNQPQPANVGTVYLDQYRLPILWGPSYASGAAVSGAIGKATYAVELKNASLSSRPASWDATAVQWQNPTVSGRIGYQPDESWSLGLSYSAGSYLRGSARATLAPGEKLGDYREIVVGQDIAFAWHHFQLWAEAYETTFEIPRIGDARTFACYVEAKYKFTPQFFAAVRWNRQLYGEVPNGAGASVKWGDDVWRIDFAPSYRFTPHTEIKFQYSLQSGGTGTTRRAATFATQFVLRF